MASDETSTVPHPHRMEALYADVIVPRHIAKAFTYRVPPTLAETIVVGRRVLVPFGRTVLEGIVISLSRHLATEIKSASIREIRSLDRDGQASTLTLPPTLLELSRKIAEYYVAPWGQCIRLILSSMTTPNTSPARYVATAPGRLALEAGSCPDYLKPILARIAGRTKGILSSTLQQNRQGNALRIDTLINKSWIAPMPPDKATIELQEPPKRHTLDEHDRRTSVDGIGPIETLPEVDSSWKTHVTHCLDSNHVRKLVLFAPWKHQLSRLVDAILQAHSMKRSTIVLTGEIVRAVWLKQVLSRFTNLPIILARPSSELSRWQSSQEIPSVVVGTRSAIFSPLKSIGLIWVEGEEDPALKEPQEPRYHAREVAHLRAESERALVVLASAHPSLESRFDTDAEIHHIPQEIALQPAIELVDLRNEPAGTLFSHKLIRAMHDALQSHAKILLFLNRKGYAGTLVCRDCGWVSRCDSCNVPLTYYREARRLTCRYCGKVDPLPDLCPLCRTPRMSPVGYGTERAEVEARRLFPQAKIARLDRDTLRHSAAAQTLWEGARSGAWDILIGTQALFRREPLPRYGLVGILHAESGLHVSDFRAAERTYHLLVDAANLACPASIGGRVLVQTRIPTHHAVQALISGDPSHFYNEEFAARRLLHYPPVCHLADLWVTGKDLRIVEEAAKRWGADLEQSASGQEPLTVLGPVPAMHRRHKGDQQYRILVKGTALTDLSRRIYDSVQKMERAYRTGRMKFVVDIDPIENG